MYLHPLTLYLLRFGGIPPFRVRGFATLHKNLLYPTAEWLHIACINDGNMQKILHIFTKLFNVHKLYISLLCTINKNNYTKLVLCIVTLFFSPKYHPFP